MSKIIRLQSTNYKRLKAVEITPDGNIVTINGKNGAGKSSVLDAITAALGGVNKRDTPMPIRVSNDPEDQPTSAEIILETEDLIVTRRFTKSGSTLTVSTHDGAKFPKGQAKLDELLGKLSLDPFAFTQLSEKDQLEALIGLVDLPFDPATLERDRKELYDRRAEIGRQGKAIGEVEVDESLPTEESSAGDLIARIQAANELAAEHRRQRDLHDELVTDIDNMEEQIQQLQESVSELKKMHVRKVEEIKELDTPEDVEPLQSQLATVEETNAAIRANNVARDKKSHQNDLRDQYSKYTKKIEALDKKKADGLAEARMPVPGLGFDDIGVTFEGIPFKQVNTASQIRVSFAMAMALNPKLRVVRIAEGSLLDDDNMALIAEMANEHDYQVWIESVGEGDGTGIVIEDGSVKA